VAQPARQAAQASHEGSVRIREQAASITGHRIPRGASGGSPVGNRSN